MKISKLLSAFFCLSVSLTVGAATITDSQGIVYNILTEPSGDQPGTCEVGDNESYSQSTAVTIPATVVSADNTYTVTAISNYAFRANQIIEVIDLSQCSGLQSIGDYAFADCSTLTSINLSGCTQLQSIASRAFYYCKALTSIDLSGCTQLQSIGSWAFYECRALTSIDLSECTALESIDSDAFYNCTAVTALYINSMEKWWNVTLSSGSSNPIIYGAQLYVKNETGTKLVTEATVPAGRSDLGWHLSGCESLQEVTFESPEDITAIENNAFSHCALNSIDLQSLVNLQTIGAAAFNYCDVLTSVDLSGCTSLTSIGQNAFSNCKALTSVNLSGCTSLQTMGTTTFGYSSALTSVDLSGCTALQSIGGNAFGSCTSMTSFYADLESWWNVTLGDRNSNPMWSGANLYNKTEQGTELVTQVTVPSGHSDLGWHLTGCISIEEVTFESPEDITSIEANAFFRCSALTAIDLSGCTALQSIGNYAFYSCRALISVDLSGCTALQSIGISAFDSCSALTQLVFPESLEQIGYQAMSYSTELTEVYCYAVNPPTMTISTTESLNYLFSTPMTTSGTLWVPAGSEEAYRNDPYWGQAKYINPIIPDIEGLEFEFDEEVMGGVEGITLEVGQTYQFTVKPIPADAVLPEITWTSSADDIAYISPEGEVEALAIGEANITAQAMVDEVELTATCKVTVISVPVETLALSQNEAEVTEGKSIQLYVTFEPADAVPSLTWKVDDDEILSLESLDEAEYTVNGLKPGKATVTVTSNDRLGQSDTCEVTVVEDMSGIASIFAEGNEADIEVYDLAGRRVEAETLKAGVYIMRRGTETKKVLVK